METIDDKQLRTFFKENHSEIADNGFTRRTMRQVRRKTNYTSQILQWVAGLAGVLLYIISGGVSLLIEGIIQWGINAPILINQAIDNLKDVAVSPIHMMIISTALFFSLVIASWKIWQEV